MLSNQPRVMDSIIMQKTAKVTLLYAFLSLPLIFIRLKIEDTVYWNTEEFMQRFLWFQPSHETIGKGIHIANGTAIFRIFQPFTYFIVALIAYWRIFDDSELQEIAYFPRMRLQWLQQLFMMQLLLDILILLPLSLDAATGWVFYGDFLAYLLPMPSWAFDVNLQNPFVLFSLFIILAVEATKFVFFEFAILLAMSYFKTARWRPVNLNRGEITRLVVTTMLLFGLYVGIMKMALIITHRTDPGTLDSSILDDHLFITMGILLPIELGFIIIAPVVLNKLIIPELVQQKVKQSRLSQLLFVAMMLLVRYLASFAMDSPYGYDIFYYSQNTLIVRLAAVSDILTTVMYAYLLMLWMKPGYQGESVAIDEELLYIRAMKVENYSV